jgi:hypothetical protein
MFQKAKYELKDGDVSIFKNDKKSADTDPDYNGTVRLSGVDYGVNLWKRQSKKGLQYLGGSARVKGEKPGTKPGPEFDDPIDF